MNLGPSGGISRSFVNSKLTPLLVIASILLGAMAVLLLPREEEPQIQVPMVDVMVGMPGASAKEVEERVVRPMEQLLWEIQGVEYVYSTAMAGKAVTIVRFRVGELSQVFDDALLSRSTLIPNCNAALASSIVTGAFAPTRFARYA